MTAVTMTDEQFETWFATRIAELPGVFAVALGGSRARGEHRPDSDWDYALYYRGYFDPDSLRAQGWSGHITDVGGWPGVMNGGGWLEIGERRVDIHYRDLDDIEYRWREAEHGRFEKQQAQFYLAGMPSYLPVGELALNRVVLGELPRPTFPARLRTEAHRRWHADASWSLRYAMRSLRQRRDLVVCLANLTRALIEEAHSRLAARGEWALNEKNIVRRAGLAGAVEQLGAHRMDPDGLLAAGVAVSELLGVELD